MIKGFKFGLMLQIAIGPIFLLFLNTSLKSGIIIALTGVLAVVLVDAFYILLAIQGLGAIIERLPRLRKILKYASTFILLLFGISTLLSVFAIHVLPVLSLDTTNTNNIFLKALIMTMSNPLTILFWSGVFSTKIKDEQFNKSQLYLFGCGAVLSTFIFLSLIAILGKTIAPSLNAYVCNSLNIITAIYLIFYALHNVVSPRLKTMITERSQVL